MLKRFLKVMVISILLLGSYVAYNRAMDLLNWPNDAAVLLGYSILVTLGFVAFTILVSAGKKARRLYREKISNR